jgi:HlyD family secretion protein
MSCDVELIKETYDNAIYCPMQCVTRLQKYPVVYVQNGSDWEPRPVEIGLDNNRMIHIIKGVEPGEVIMMAPPVKETQEQEQQEDNDGKSKK